MRCNEGHDSPVVFTISQADDDGFDITTLCAEHVTVWLAEHADQGPWTIDRVPEPKPKRRLTKKEKEARDAFLASLPNLMPLRLSPMPPLPKYKGKAITFRTFKSLE